MFSYWAWPTLHAVCFSRFHAFKGGAETLGNTYGRALYKTRRAMPHAAKPIAVSFRVSPRFKQLLQLAAARENRSQTNMLETLLFSYCEREGVYPEAHNIKNKALPK